MRFRFALAVSASMALAGCGGGGGAGESAQPASPPASSPSLPTTVNVSVTGAGPLTPVEEGGTVPYVVTVSNAGPGAARDVAITSTLGLDQTLASVSCVAAGGAVCPSTLGATMTAPLLPKDASLTLTLSAKLAPYASGEFHNDVAVKAADDPYSSDDTVTLRAASGQGSYISLESTGYVGQGRSYLYTPATAVMEVTAAGATLTFGIGANDDYSWSGTISLSGKTQLQVGSYSGLQRFPGGPVGSIDVGGQGRGCNETAGTVVIDSVSYTGAALTSLDLRFEQTCAGFTGTLKGRILWFANDPTRLPAVIAPPPPGLWAPAAGSVPADRNHVFLQSDPGEYVGDGKTHVYTQSNAVLSVSNPSDGVIQVTVTGDEKWLAHFKAMPGMQQLQPGYYRELGAYVTASNPNMPQGGMDWGGEGRGCTSVGSWFIVDSVSYTNGTLSSLDLRFEQLCGVGTALRGEIHWSAADSSGPADPVNPPPAGLWSPPADATPATGSYVYLASESGDTVGEGRSYLYTPATSTITLTTVGAGLSIAIPGNERWSGDLQPMNTITQLHPGYYGDLERYPFHNPTKGGLSWSSLVGGGCNTLQGWFVVDSVSYVNSVITAIDFRFEQHCEGKAPALHGKVHWVQ